MLLRNHGTLSVGDTAANCWVGMFYLERSCTMQVKAMSAGRDKVLIAPQASQDEVKSQTRGGMGGALAWPACLRKLDRDCRATTPVQTLIDQACGRPDRGARLISRASFSARNAQPSSCHWTACMERPKSATDCSVMRPIGSGDGAPVLIRRHFFLIAAVVILASWWSRAA
jgi:hypothetical protein